MDNDKTTSPDTNAILVDLEFVKSLVVNLDVDLEKDEPEKVIKSLQEARDRIEEVIRQLQYGGGI